MSLAPPPEPATTGPTTGGPTPSGPTPGGPGASAALPADATGRRMAPRVVVALVLAMFGLFLALLGPVFVTMTIKAGELRPDDAASVIASVLPWGALAALVANPVFGSLSDRTRGRFGRRRPWLVGGVVVFLVGLAWVGVSGSVGELTAAWVLAQLAANAVLAVMMATLADQTSQEQRAKVSAHFGTAQNVAVLAAYALALFVVSALDSDVVVLFVAPGMIAVVLVVLYAAVLDDAPLTEAPPRRGAREVLATFWVNPVRHRDFALAWWSRFLIIFATFMFTTYRQLYVVDRFGLSDTGAVLTVFLGVLVYTVALVLAAQVSGWASDRMGRRKLFVAGSTAILALGLIMLAHAETVTAFYVAEAVMGAAYGVYVAVDTALVLEVLPDPERAGKDLGVLNIANAAPQSLAPVLGLALLGLGTASGDHTNYTALLWGAGIVGLIGALVIIPVRTVR